MRYSSVNHWYKIEEVLGGLDGTSSGEVQVQLLRHLGSGHISKLTLDGPKILVSPQEGDELSWSFRGPDAAKHFLDVVCEWFKAQGVAVPAH